MAIGENEFLKGLKFKDGETSQKEVAKENIRKQLFKILMDSNLQKGESRDLYETAEEIANNLGMQQNKEKIAQYIIQLFQGDQYQYNIDESGNIKANYSRLYMIQKERDRKGHEEAEEILQGFIQKVERYAKEMEQKKVVITEASLMRQFEEKELQRNSVWIDLAIDHVLEAREQEK